MNLVAVWSSGAATLDSIADFQNPWGSGSPAGPPPAGPFSNNATDAGWADFSNFETNFSSSTQLNDGQKSQEPSDLFCESMTAKEDSEGKFHDSFEFFTTRPFIWKFNLTQWFKFWTDLENAQKVPIPNNSVEILPSTSETDDKSMQDPISTGVLAAPIAAGVRY